MANQAVWSPPDSDADLQSPNTSSGWSPPEADADLQFHKTPWWNLFGTAKEVVHDAPRNAVEGAIAGSQGGPKPSAFSSGDLAMGDSPDFPEPEMSTGQFLDKAGMPKNVASNPISRTAGAAVRGGAGGLVAGGPLGVVPGAVGSGSSNVAKEAGASPTTQTLVGLGAGLLAGPGVLPAVRRIPGNVSDAVKGIRELASGNGFDMPEPANVDARALGLITADDASSAGLTLAGASAKPELHAHHQAIGDAVAKAEAGLNQDLPLAPDNLTIARGPARRVVQRAAESTPTGPVDQQTLDEIDKSGGLGLPISGKGSIANVKDMQENLKAELSKPDLTGATKAHWLQALRDKGHRNMASEDPGSQDLGEAQLNAAKALEGHIERSLPADGPVSIAQFREARTSLAKNHTVEESLKGNNIDLKTLARIYHKNPNLMTDGLGMLGRFAEENPEVVGIPKKLDKPSLLKDVVGINLERPLATGLQAIGGPTGRALLRGSTSTAVENAIKMFTKDPNRFAPIPPKGPQAPPGMTASTPPPTSTPPRGSSDYADVLSQGVEQTPPEGLSLAPMGAPRQSGMPFQRNAAHEAGGLELAPENSWFTEKPNNSDLPKVASQGVPEGITARTAPRSSRSYFDRTVDAIHDVVPFENNASGESAASQEAINRGTRNIVEVTPDGKGNPVLKDVTQVDRKAQKGHLLVDAKTGEIIDRGGLGKIAAEGLRNRWAYYRHFAKE